MIYRMGQDFFDGDFAAIKKRVRAKPLASFRQSAAVNLLAFIRVYSRFKNWSKARSLVDREKDTLAHLEGGVP